MKQAFFLVATLVAATYVVRPASASFDPSDDIASSTASFTIPNFQSLKAQAFRQLRSQTLKQFVKKALIC